MKWFSENPHNPGIRGDLMWESHTWARQNFASSFARNGFAATAFAPTAGEAFKSAFRPTIKKGSERHISNLMRLQNQYPDNPDIQSAIQKAKMSGTVKSSLTKRVLGKSLGIGMVGLPMFLTEGSLQDKARATAGGVAGLAGWSVGSKVGMGTGAAIGSMIPVVGTGIGAAIGWVAGGFLGAIGADEGFQSLTRIPDRMVERERGKRKLDWVQDTSAFMTEGAHTMRQRSVQAMNRGLMNSRSLLGKEAVMIHR